MQKLGNMKIIYSLTSLNYIKILIQAKIIDCFYKLYNFQYHSIDKMLFISMKTDANTFFKY